MVGNYFVLNEFVTSAKMNEMVDNNSAGVAQNAYQTLQANNVFQNKDFLAAEEYTISGGTNGTVNTGSSTALFNGNQYDLTTVGVSENSPNEVSTTNSYNILTTTLTASSTGYITSVAMSGNNVGSISVTINIKNSVNTIVATKTITLTTLYDLTVTTFTSSDYSEPISIGLFTIEMLYTGALQNATNRTYNGTNFSYSAQTTPAFTQPKATPIFTFVTAPPNISGKTVVCDTGTLTLDGTEKSIQIYGDNTLPTGNGPDGTNDTTATSLTLSTSGAVTDKRGLKINPNEDLYVQSVTKNSTSTATTATIYAPNAGPVDISTLVYASKSFDATSQDTGPNGVFFKSDGLIMYLMGNTNDIIYQYTLTTAWDVSTASYASKSFSVATQTTFTADVLFNTTGTKMYALDINTPIIYQYTLTTAWDVSTASYASKSFSVATQEAFLRSVSFKSDGLSMYAVGTQNGTVYQYTLSTAFDVNTATYVSKSLSVAAQTTAPSGLLLSSDGTKVYVQGGTTYYQYTLSTAWDISTGSYDTKSFNFNGQSSATGQLFISENVDYSYIIDSTNNKVFQYSTGISKISATATFSGNTATFSTQVKLTSGTNYYLLTDSGGSSFTSVTDSTVTFPLTGTVLDVTAGVNSTSTEILTEYYNLTSIVTQTNSATSSNATSVSVDISDGTTTLSTQPFTNNTTGVIDISSLSSGTLKLTYNLITLDTAVTPSTKGWGVFIFK